MLSDLVVAPPHAAGRVIGGGEDVGLWRDDGVTVEQRGIRIGFGAIDRDVERAVTEAATAVVGRRDECDTFAGGAAGRGQRVVVRFVGHQVTAHGQIGCSTGREEVNLPGDLLDRHLNAVGDVREIVRGDVEVCQGGVKERGVEGDVRDGLLARVELEGITRIARHGDVVRVATPGHEVAGHQQGLADAVLVVISSGFRMGSQGFADVEVGVPGGVASGALQPESPRERFARDRGFEVAQTFGRDGAQTAAAGGVGRQRAEVGDKDVTGEQ